MADRPIIFSAPMVQALLAGRKSQTRRVLPLAHPKFSHQNVLDPDMMVDKQYVWFWDGVHDCVGASWPLPYAPGDRLWVRENCATWGDHEAIYRADDAVEYGLAVSDGKFGAKWKARPSIHMPRWASRLTLTVTDVRVQRLQDISEADAVAEGCDAVLALTIKRPNGAHPGNPRECYCDLWNSLHGPGAWDANPWVVALTFTVQCGNIDKMPGEK